MVTTGRMVMSRAIASLALMLPALALAPSAFAGDDGGARSVFATGAGNRAIALGGAFAAVADDPSAVLWNPAGLALLERRQAQVTHTNLFGLGFSEQYASIAWPSWRWGVASFTMRSFGVGGLDSRDERNVVLEEDLSDRETEITLGYARQIGELWNVGGAFKLQRQSLAGYSGSGLGIDVGVLTKPLLVAHSGLPWAESVTAGLAIRNLVEPSIRLDQEEVADPTGIRLGVAVRRPFREAGQILAALDLEKTSDMSTRMHAGVEVRPVPILALRTGLGAGRFEMGTGVRWRDFDVDYAFEDNPLGGIHRFGISYAFGQTVAENRQAALAAEEAKIEERLAQAFEERNRSRVADLVAAAESAIAAERFDDALSTLSMIEVLDPTNPRTTGLQVMVLRGKGLQLERAGDLTAAAVTLGRALSLAPEDAETAQALERVRSESDLLASRSEEIRALYESALAAYAADDLLAARDGFRGILDLAPDDRDAATMFQHTEDAIALRIANLATEARTLAQAGAFDEAEAALTRARHLDGSAEALRQAGADVAAMRHDHETSLARRKSEAARPETFAASGRTSDATVPSGTVGGPGAPARRRLSEAKRAEIADFYRRGVDAIGQDRAEEAVRYWEFVWSADPGYENVSLYLKQEYLTRGMEAFAAGRLQDAVEDWEQALRVDPADQRARGYLARAQEKIARYREIVGDTRVATRN